MRILPIVGRELRVAARKRATYWLRFSSALAAICLFTWIFFASRHTPVNRLSQSILVSLSVLFFIFCLLIGIRNTADCLSEEKREGTLGLLFLTDLKGYDVVIGKLVANSVHAFFSLLATFPILALPLLMGGVNRASVGLILMVLLNTLIFSLCLGLLASTLCKSPIRSMGLAFFLIALFTIGIPLIGLIADAYFGLAPQKELWFAVTSPGYPFIASLESLGKTTVLPAAAWKPFWISSGAVLVLSWLALVISALWLPRAWKDRPTSPWGLQMRNTWRSFGAGSEDRRNAFRTTLLRINPMYWLAGRNRFKGALVWLAFGIAGLLWLWGYWENRNQWLEIPFAILTSLVLHTILKVALISESCRQLNEQRKSGALELLLSTPLTVRQLIDGIGLALRRAYGYPTAFVIIVDVTLLWAGLRRGSGPDNGAIVLVFIAGMAILLLDLYAIKWIGLWRGLNAAGFPQAAGSVGLIILVLPWVLFAMASTILTLLRLRFEAEHLVFLWFFLSAAVALLCGLRARSKLTAELREIATQPRTKKGRKWFYRETYA